MRKFVFAFRNGENNGGFRQKRPSSEKKKYSSETYSVLTNDIHEKTLRLDLRSCIFSKFLYLARQNHKEK